MVPSLESPTLSLLSIGCCKDMQQCTRSGRFIQYSSRSAACRAHAPERRRVLLGLSSAAASASVPVLDSLAKEAQLERFLSAESGFLFEYPPGWTVAIDRSSMKTLGILVVAGDFNNAVTINVIRQQLSELQLPGKFSLAELQTDEGMRKFQQGAEVGAATQANIFEFGILSSSIRVGQKNRLYCDLEYTNSICKSEILEGRGGRKRCVDAFDNTVSTPLKHAFRTTTLGTDGYVYTATASTYDTKWTAYQDMMRTAAQSLQVA